MTYRPDIDGLRAIAVLAVLWHHYSPQTMPGGFVGVDIFFVISGFLITHQILVQLSQGVWSSTDFYRKRIHRIVPALWVVLMVCLLVGAWQLSPADWVLLSKSAVAAFFGVSNLFFWQEYGNYFGGNAKEALLLHTWSLGVEEQFYLVWPIVLLLAVRLPKKWLAVLGVLGLLSAVAFSELAVGRYASASYYLLPTRFFELMLGGLLAWFLLNHSNTQLPLWLANAIVVAALALLVASLWELSPSSPFPGWRALMPTLAAALLICAGLQKHAATGFLTHRYVVQVGLISYSLYLWHWPIVAWLNYRQIAIEGLVLCGALGASFVLAHLTWRFVEQPVRRSAKNVTLLQTLTQRLLPAALVLLLSAGAVVYFSGFQTRFNPLVAEFEASLKQRPEQIRSGCHVPTALYAGVPNSEVCRLGDVELKPTALLWGDSYANHFSGAINVMAKQQGLSVVDYTMDACPPILGYHPVGSDSYAQKCVVRNQQALDFAHRSGIDRVILAANWPSDQGAYSYLKTTLNELKKKGFSVTFIHKNQDIPSAPKCAVQRAMKESVDECGVPVSPPSSRLLDLLDQYANLSVLKPSDVMCDKEHCDPVRDRVLLYRDAGHLNDDGARWLGQQWIARGNRL